MNLCYLMCCQPTNKTIAFSNVSAVMTTSETGGPAIKKRPHFVNLKVALFDSRRISLPKGQRYSLIYISLCYPYIQLIGGFPGQVCISNLLSTPHFCRVSNRSLVEATFPEYCLTYSCRPWYSFT